MGNFIIRSAAINNAMNEPSDSVDQVADSQKQLIQEQEKIREEQKKIEEMQDELAGAQDKGFFEDIGNFLTGGDPGASESNGVKTLEQSSCAQALEQSNDKRSRWPWD